VSQPPTPVFTCTNSCGTVFRSDQNRLNLPHVKPCTRVFAHHHQLRTLIRGLCTAASRMRRVKQTRRETLLTPALSLLLFPRLCRGTKQAHVHEDRAETPRDPQARQSQQRRWWRRRWRRARNPGACPADWRKEFGDREDPAFPRRYGENAPGSAAAATN